MKDKINIIFGPTASGKTQYSLDLAKKLDGEIVNFDSMQVYKEIPIISAQPTMEERSRLKHHLFGIISLSDTFSVANWLKLSIDAIEQIKSEGKTPILVGGTGMYIKALMEGLAKTPRISSATKEKVHNYRQNLSTNELHAILKDIDVKSAKNISINDSQRIIRALEIFFETGRSLKEWQDKASSLLDQKLTREDFHIIKIEKPRAIVYENINARFEHMISNGAIDEANIALNTFGNINYPKAIGLLELMSYIKGDITLKDAISNAQQLSRNYAKRQITWMNHQINYYNEVTNLAS